jgi:hypothetical protein
MSPRDDAEPTRITPELNSLFVHLMSEREDIALLKEKLAKAEQRVFRLSDDIKAICKESADCTPSVADAAAALNSLGVGGSLSSDMLPHAGSL